MEDVQPTKHICGQCNDEWLTEQEYLDHVCPKSGVEPTNPANLGPDFPAIQQAALERGAAAAAEQAAPAPVADTPAAPQPPVAQ